MQAARTEVARAGHEDAAPGAQVVRPVVARAHHQVAAAAEAVVARPVLVQQPPRGGAVGGGRDQLRPQAVALGGGAAIEAEPEGHSDPVEAVVTFVDPATGALRVATGSWDQNICVWDAETGGAVLVIDVGSDDDKKALALDLTGRITGLWQH